MGWANAGWQSDAGGWYKNAAVSLPVLTKIGSATANTVSNVATASGVGIGTASADRLVVVVITAANLNTATSSCSIAGGTTTLVVQAPQVNGSSVTICQANVTTGTTANLSITYSFVGDGVVIAFDVYTITGLSSMTATGSAGNSNASASTQNTGSLTSSTGGVAVIGCAQRSSNSTTCVVTGTSGTLTQDRANFALGGFSLNTVASATSLSASAATTFTATWNGTEVTAIAAAAWR